MLKNKVIARLDAFSGSYRNLIAQAAIRGGQRRQSPFLVRVFEDDNQMAVAIKRLVSQVPLLRSDM